MPGPHRGAASADPDVVAIIERDNRVQEERILGALEQRRPPHPLLVIAVRAWLLYLRTAWLECIDRPEVPRDEIREVCVAALVGALGGLPKGASRRGWTVSPSRVPSVTRPFERRVDEGFPQTDAEPPNPRMLR